MDTLREILSPDFLLRNSIYISLLVGLVCPLVGVYLTLRRLIFMGVALPQVSSCGIAFAFSVHWALVATNRYFAEADGRATFLVLPSSAIWWLFPGFGALCLSWEITLFLWSLFSGRGRVTRFIDWTSERAGYDSTRALRWMTLFIAMPVGVATVLALPMHSALRDNDIVVGHYATLARQSLPYSHARRLVLVDGFRDRSGKFSARAGVIVDFDNGLRWSSSDIGDFKSEVDPALAELLQQRDRHFPATGVHAALVRPHLRPE